MLLLTGPWGESIVVAGLMISVGPLTVAVVSVQVRRLVPRFGARRVATAGCLMLAAGGAWWAAWIDASPAYVTDFLPGMIVGAIGVGLTQASLFGLTARVLPGNRFATGFGVLNMSRQIGLALGVAILVALLGAAPAIGDFHQGYWEMVVAGILAAAVAAGLPGRGSLGG